MRVGAAHVRREIDALPTLEKGGIEMTAERKTPESKIEESRARRSRRIHAFLNSWARRHWPERVTRFPKR